MSNDNQHINEEKDDGVHRRIPEATSPTIIVILLPGGPLRVPGQRPIVFTHQQVNDRPSIRIPF